MPPITPTWFAADKVFERSGGWYVGSKDGLSVGPYESRDAAMTQSVKVRAQLMSARNVGDRLRILRHFLEKQQDDLAHQNGRPPETVPVRVGEQPKLRFRSERSFAIDGKWYFMTREGIDVGPYHSQRACERDARRLVKLLKRCETEEQAHLTIYEFMGRPLCAEAVAIRRKSPRR